NVFDDAVRSEEAKSESLRSNAKAGAADPNVNPYVIAAELGREMTDASTVVKTGARLERAIEKIHELQERCKHAALADASLWTNQNLVFTRSLSDMIKLAEVILVGGLARKESRGSHYRLDYPDRDDANFLRTTIAEYDASTGRPKISYRE